jgi:hypothetical protein
MCPDGVVAYHESLSSFRPGFESRSGRNGHGAITCGSIPQIAFFVL